jgi:hypothetical protein
LSESDVAGDEKRLRVMPEEFFFGNADKGLLAAKFCRVS